MVQRRRFFNRVSEEMSALMNRAEETTKAHNVRDGPRVGTRRDGSQRVGVYSVRLGTNRVQMNKSLLPLLTAAACTACATGALSNRTTTDAVGGPYWDRAGHQSTDKLI